MPESPMLTDKAIGKGRDALYASRDGGGTMHTAPAEVVRAFLAAQDREALARDRTMDGTVIRIVDAAHAENLGGKHHDGFCEACADALLVAQRSIRPNIDALLGGDPER